jgi:hypothetical protein
MFPKQSLAKSIAAVAAIASLTSLAEAFQTPNSPFDDPQNNASPSVRQTAPPDTVPPETVPPDTAAQQGAVTLEAKGSLASAMASFLVRTGLVVGSDAQGGLVVEHIRPESDASRLGVKVGDVVTGVNGTATNSIRDLESYLVSHIGQSAFDVSVSRGRRTFTHAMGRQVSLLGMTVFPNSADAPYVYSVLADSPAAKAGVKPGDVITSVGDKTTETMTKLMNFGNAYMRSRKDGQGVGFRLVRNGNPITLSVLRPKDSEIEPLTPSEQHIADRQAGVLSTETQEMARPAATQPARRPHGDLTSVVAVLYGPSQRATVGQVRGTVGNVMVQFTVPAPQTLNPPGVVLAVPQTSVTVQPSGSLINPGNPSMVPNLGGPAMGPPLVGGNVAAIVTANLAGLPEGRYDLVVGQFGDCADLTAVAMQQVATRLGTILVHSNGEGSLNAPVGIAPRDFLARTVAVVAPTAPGSGNVVAAEATANTGNTVTTGVWGCGVFHLANPRKPLPAEYPANRVYPDGRPVAVPPSAPAIVPPTSTPVPPVGPPVPVQPQPTTP